MNKWIGIAIWKLLPVFYNLNVERKQIQYQYKNNCPILINK